VARLVEAVGVATTSRYLTLDGIDNVLARLVDYTAASLSVLTKQTEEEALAMSRFFNEFASCRMPTGSISSPITKQMEPLPKSQLYPMVSRGQKWY